MGVMILIAILIFVVLVVAISGSNELDKIEDKEIAISRLSDMLDRIEDKIDILIERRKDGKYFTYP